MTVGVLKSITESAGCGCCTSQHESCTLSKLWVFTGRKSSKCLIIPCSCLCMWHPWRFTNADVQAALNTRGVPQVWTSVRAHRCVCRPVVCGSPVVCGNSHPVWFVTAWIIYPQLVKSRCSVGVHWTEVLWVILTTLVPVFGIRRTCNLFPALIQNGPWRSRKMWGIVVSVAT